MYGKGLVLKLCTSHLEADDCFTARWFSVLLPQNVSWDDTFQSVIFFFFLHHKTYLHFILFYSGLWSFPGPSKFFVTVLYHFDIFALPRFLFYSSCHISSGFRSAWPATTCRGQNKSFVWQRCWIASQRAQFTVHKDIREEKFSSVFLFFLIQPLLPLDLISQCCCLMWICLKIHFTISNPLILPTFHGLAS